jgi:HSP20 family protein
MAEPAKSETETKAPAKTEAQAPERAAAPQAWRPFEDLRRQVDRLFEDFDRGFWAAPFRRPMFSTEPFWRRAGAPAAPAVDIVEKDNAYEVTAELPGMDEKDIEVELSNGNLTIKGKKEKETEEKKEDYYLHERHFGSFERSFAVPEGVDADKIEASFQKGVLTIVLPKSPEAVKPKKKIEVKAADATPRAEGASKAAG